MTIKELRENAQLSQRALAQKIGMTQPAIIRVERLGRTKISTVERLAAALGCTEQAIHEALKETRKPAPIQCDN